MNEQADPLYVPREGCCKFSVAVYNQTVREAVKQNKTHHVYDERWAEEKHMEVVADDAEGARTKVLQQYPASEGFVVTGVERLSYDV